MKQINIDSHGYVDATGLDDIEINLIDKFTKGVNGIAFQKVMIEALGKELGFILTPGAVVTSVQRSGKPFHWLDDRFGSGRYTKTPEPEAGEILRFMMMRGQLDETDRSRREKSARLMASPFYGSGYGRTMDKYYTPPAGGWLDPVYFELDPSCEIPQLHRDMLQVFLPGSGYCRGSRFDRYFQMHIKAASELARRLGYKPVFDEEVIE